MPKLFLVDPQCAIVNFSHEIASTLRRIFAAEGRTLKYYIKKDADQLPPDRIQKLCEVAGEQIVTNSYGVVVRDYTNVDFVARCQPAN